MPMKTKISLLLAVVLAVVAGCKYDRGVKSAVPVSGEWLALMGLPCVEAPANAELLDESGALALFVGETAEDTDSNKARDDDPDRPYRNSLFLCRRRADGTGEWRVLLTTGSNWREATGADKWCLDASRWLKDHFNIREAKFASDKRHLWLVCNTCNAWWDVVCSYDMQTDEFRVLIDGDALEEQPNGTILVHGKKFYPRPDDGRGAAWHDVWITPEGKIVHEGKITLRGSDL